jgi:hypothetical protein
MDKFSFDDESERIQFKKKVEARNKVSNPPFLFILASQGTVQ